MYNKKKSWIYTDSQTLHNVLTGPAVIASAAREYETGEGMCLIRALIFSPNDFCWC